MDVDVGSKGVKRGEWGCEEEKCCPQRGGEFEVSLWHACRKAVVM